MNNNKKVKINLNSIPKKELKGEIKTIYRKKLLEKFLKILDIKELEGSTILFDTLKNPNIINQLFKYVNELKKVYKSDKLTSLHKNAISKQQFPGVNIVRQILKDNGYQMNSRVQSMGYNGKHKVVQRYYIITKINNKI